jgi:hemerythrin
MDAQPPATSNCNEETPMTTIQAFTWSDRYLLGHQSIDDTHREFVEHVRALQEVSDIDIPAALEAFIRHAEAHFSQENAWLNAPDFPGGGECHIEEHEKVLSAAYDVREVVALGRYHVARAYAQALVDWFPGHADYMDSALATWLVKCSHNGRPLVFRRLETV